MTSPSLYRILSQLFFLPSVWRLQQLSAGLHVKNNDADIAYLKQRTRKLKLTNSEKYVLLMLDKIYEYKASKVEYPDGRFIVY